MFHGYLLEDKGGLKEEIDKAEEGLKDLLDCNAESFQITTRLMALLSPAESACHVLAIILFGLF